jgi:hypothetical protein
MDKQNNELANKISDFIISKLTFLVLKYSSTVSESVSEFEAMALKKQIATFIDDYFKVEDEIVLFIKDSFHVASKSVQDAEIKQTLSYALSIKGKQLDHLLKSLSSAALYFMAKAEDANIELTTEIESKLKYISTIDVLILITRAVPDEFSESVDVFGIPK